MSATPPSADLPAPAPDGWRPDPVLEARRREVFRRCEEEGRQPTAEEFTGLFADLWASDEEFEQFVRYAEGKE